MFYYIYQNYLRYRGKLQMLNLFWFGIVLFSVTSTFLTFNFQTTILRFFQVFSVLIIFSSLFFVIEHKIDSKYLKYVFILYLLWQITIIFRGDFSLNKNFLFEKILNTRGFLMYFTPLLLFYPRNLFYYKKLLNVIMIMGIIYLISLIIFRKDVLSFDNRDAIENLTKYLEFGIGFILLTLPFNGKRRQIIAVVVIIVTIVIVAYKARRSNLFMQCEYVFISFFLYSVINKMKSQRNYFYSIIITFVFIGIGFLYENQKNDTFKLLTERLNDDSRSNVEAYWWNDFSKKPFDLLVGRGIDGSYKQDVYNDDGMYVSNKRTIIETGYLNIIMKGGIITLLLLLLIAVPAIYNGLFKSKNVYSKAAAMMIVIWLVDLYPDSYSSFFNIKHIVFWICIGICYSIRIREYSDYQLKRILR